MLSIFNFSFLTIHAQSTLYSTDFGTGSSLPAEWIPDPGNDAGAFTASSVNPSSGYIDPNASGTGNLLATDGASFGFFNPEIIILNASISTTNFANIKVKWGGVTSGGFPGFALEWSVDNWATPNTISFTDINYDGTWQTIPEIVLPAGAEGAANLQFRFSFNATNSGVVYRFDDFRVTGIPSNAYYSKSSGANLELLTSWTKNPDGTGVNPPDFTTSGAVYNIRNNANFTIGGAWTVSGSGAKVVVESASSSNFTIPSGFAFSTSGGATIDVLSGATLTMNNTTIPTLGIIDAASTVIYGASSSQTITAITYGNLTVSGGSSVQHNMGGDVTVIGILNIAASTKLGMGSNSLTLNGTISGSGTITGSTTSNMTIGGTGALGTITFTGSNVKLNNFTINRTSSGTVTLGIGLLAVSGTLSLTDGILFANAGLNLTGPVSQTSGTISYSSGTPGVVYNSASAGQFVASGTYYNLAFSNFNKTLASGTISVFNTFNKGTANGHSTTGSTIDYNGTGAQTISAFNYNNLTISNARTGANNITLISGGTISIAGTFNPTATFGTGGYVITNNTMDFNGAGSQTIPAFTYNNLNTSTGGTKTLSGTVTVNGILTVNASSTIDLSSQTLNLTGSGTPLVIGGTFTPSTSTVNYTNAGSTNVTAATFYNLNLTGGARVLPNGGTVGITNTFTPGAGAFTVTGNTIDFTGAGAQSIPAFTYNNLNTSTGGTKTLSGTVTVNNILTIGASSILDLSSQVLNLAGSGTPLVINGTFTPSTSTVNYTSASSANITATNFYNLNLTGGARVLPNGGTVGIANIFTPGAGAFTVTGSTVNFNGAAQSVPVLPSSVNYNNITVSGSGTKSLTGSTGMTGVLTILAGNFDAGANVLTMVSTASGTASIATIPGGSSFLGSIIMQRYALGSPNGNDWRFLSSAVQGSHISDWTDNFTTSGFTGATCPPTDCTGGCAWFCSWPSIYTYNPTITGGVMNNGWVPAGSTGDATSAGKGFDVYLGPTPVTFDVQGVPNQSGQPLNVGYTNYGIPTDDGWNLVPNPYPCAIDWNSGSWTKTNINNAVYIYNASALNGGYASYVSGASTNGGSQYIASQQSFFVQASGAPTLTATESVKASAQNPTFQRPAYLPNTSHYPMAFTDFPIPLNSTDINNIRLTATGNGHEDELLIRFMQGATNNFDGQYDAWKLFSTDSTTHNFSSLDANNQDLSINSFPELNSDISIPIRLTMPYLSHGPHTYNYSISRDSILMIPMSSCLILEDKAKLTNNMIDLRATRTYTFTFSDTAKAPRFILHFYAPMTKKSKNITCNGANNGIAIAKGSGTGPWNYVWKNSAGIVVKPSHSSLTADTLFNCAPGTYSVSVDGAVCGTVTDTIIINSPPVFTTSVSQTNISCFGLHNGIATISSLGGTPSYTYHWGDNQTTSSISNLSHGNYSVVITDANGCTNTSTITITEPTALSTTVSQTSVSCFNGNNGSSTATASGGSPSYSYLWNDNDGQTTSAATGLLSGNYFAIVTDANGCTNTASVTITQPTSALTVSTTVSPAQCNSSNGVASANAGGGTSGYSYLWSNNKTTTTLSGLHANSYSVLITDAKGCTTIGVANVSNIGGVTASIASTTSLTCNGGNNGSATVSISGGTPTVSYSWNTSSVQTTVSATGLSAGNYIATVTDGAGCISIASVTIDEPTALTITSSKTNVSCFGGNNGVVTLTETGGTPSYSYSWNNGNSTSSASNLSAGNYSITTTDAHGCTKSAVVAISQPSIPLSISASKTNISCFGLNNGHLEFTASGGTPSYTYLWNNSLTSSSASHLSSGNYSITITDANGCTKDTSFNIIEPSILTYSISLTNVSCFGGSNGTSTISASGGSPSYSYLWSNGQSSSAATNLSAGNYSVKITDSNGCSTSTAVSISQPTSMITAGFTASTYTVDLAVSGTVNFTNNSIGSSIYQWNFGDTTAINNAANPTHNYIHAGTYTVMLTASDGTCSDVIYKTIVVTNSNPLAVASPISSSSVNVIYDNNEVFLQFSLNKKTQINITVYNLIGEKISSQNNLQIKNEKIKLDLHNPSAGIYLAVSETPDGNISKKIVIPADR